MASKSNMGGVGWKPYSEVAQPGRTQQCRIVQNKRGCGDAKGRRAFCKPYHRPDQLGVSLCAACRLVSDPVLGHRCGREARVDFVIRRVRAISYRRIRGTAPEVYSESSGLSTHHRLHRRSHLRRPLPAACAALGLQTHPPLRSAQPGAEGRAPGHGACRFERAASQRAGARRRSRVPPARGRHRRRDVPALPTRALADHGGAGASARRRPKRQRSLPRTAVSQRD